jgi:hypothetical protein
MQNFPQEAELIRLRAHDERNRSRDATVAKLLNARTAMRSDFRTGIEASAAQALADVPNSSATDSHSHTVEETPFSIDYTDQGRDKSRLRDSIVCEPSELEFDDQELEVEPFKPKLTHDESLRQGPSTSGSHRTPAQQHSALMQARQRAQGMILSLQDTISTLEALEHAHQANGSQKNLQGCPSLCPQHR